MSPLAQPTPSDLPYRPDIDGLRAIAVLAVVAYHLDFAFARGGFVGVDIFFVISGYLITTIIQRRIAAGSFSLGWFYLRRARRILPALFAMLAACLVVGWAGLLPSEFLSLGRSSLAAVFSASNLLFLHQTGYFDDASALNPLLHTWSLAVEEQFYLILPLLLLLLHRFARTHTRKVLAVLALASLATATLYLHIAPERAFFTIESRGWELLLGGLITTPSIFFSRRPLLRNLSALLGFALIAASVGLYARTTPFPGLAALLPCFGCALVLTSGQAGPTLVSRLLSFAPLTLVGRFSYSLYLWHWPILVLSNLGVLPRLPTSFLSARLTLFVEMIVAGFFSWRLIETPFRRPGTPQANRRFLAGIASVCFVLALAALAVSITHGVPQRFSADANRIASFQSWGGNAAAERAGTCMVTGTRTSQQLDADQCLRLSTSTPNVLLLGDSHAAHLWYGLSLAYPDWNLMQATAADCKPLLDAATSHSYCQRFRDYIFTSFLPQHHLDAILLSADWNESDSAQLARTLDSLRSTGVQIDLIGPNPVYDQPLPRLLVRARSQTQSALPSQHLVLETWALDRSMREIASARAGVTYISLLDLLCPNRVCVEFAAPLTPLSSDGSHFTPQGSEFAARAMRASGLLR